MLTIAAPAQTMMKTVSKTREPSSASLEVERIVARVMQRRSGPHKSPIRIKVREYS